MARIAPQLNTGSVALQHLFSKLYKPGPWHEALYEPGDFLALYQEMFGDPWARAAQVEPLFPEDRAAAAQAAIFAGRALELHGWAACILEHWHAAGR